MAQKQAVILDVDGVLAKTANAIYAGCCNVFKHGGRGLRPPSRETFFQNVSAPFPEYYRSLGVKGTDEQMTTWYFEVAKHDEAPLFSDVAPVLEALVERGIWLGIVSGHSSARLKERFAKAGLQRHFQSIVGNQHEKSRAIRGFCETHEVPFHQAFYVGDLRSDILDGRRAGVRTVGITRFNQTRKSLLAAGAHFCIQHLPELLPLLAS